MHPYYKVIKRILDIFIAVLAIIITSPVMLIASIMVLCDRSAKGSLIFKQNRFGKDGKLFKIYKFRTMRKDAPDEVPTGVFSDVEKYLTRPGKFLRKTSIDELPQLFNVLKGDMSIVGPRPLVRTEEEIHKLRQKNGIYTILPGVTGWAQVNGRDMVGAEEKTEYDKEYLRRMSFWFDLKILLMTARLVVSGYGVVEGAETEKAES
ncbi:MAG: sugar transferase [Clostridia bacterium]|nr:sugar transferase [Clostridia bacterium]